MWQKFWNKWTIDKPAAFSDWVWDVFVVQLSAFIYGLTWRHVVTIFLLVIVIIAYNQGIPLPPEIAFAGDLLAYIDVFSLLILLGVLSRLTTMLYFLKRANQQILRFASRVRMIGQTLHFRNRRQHGTQSGNRFGKRAKSDEDGPGPVADFAWA